MEEAGFDALKGKIVKGVFALTSRTFILQIIAFTANLILTILLAPAIYGVFFVVSALINFLSYFSDIGLAAALIQKKDEPSLAELRTVFSIQQLLVGTVLMVGLLLSKQIGIFYKLDQNGIFLYQALVVSFFLSSLKTIPSVLLERRLEFHRLVLPQIFETLAFYLTAVGLAWAGFGIASFAWAALARGLVGLICIYIISPWRIGFDFSIKTVKHLLKFGVPFQTNSLLALVKDDLMTLFLGKILPFQQLGYIGWAKKWAEVPLRLIMDSVIRVTFPAYSRLQHDKKILGRAIEKSIFFLSLFIIPATVLIVFAIAPLVYIIPKYIKWEPALISLYIFAISSILASYSSTLINALNAIGKIKTTLILMIVWTICTWIFIPAFIGFIGFNGFALSNLFISLTFFIPILILKKEVQFRIILFVYKPLIASIIMAVPTIILFSRLHNVYVLGFALGLDVFIYITIGYFWMRKEIIPYLPRFSHKS
jgi:O-antigen/teichoic acid export membrane protein